MKNIVFILLFLVHSGICAQDVFGKWKTIDDKSGDAKSIVEIYEIDGKVYGKIVKLINPKNKEPRCAGCEDDRKDQLVLGMEIIRDMEKDGEDYEDGTICDPSTGEVYDCKIWIEDDEPNKLQVRGYVFLFYRTQTWVRVE